MKKFL